MEPWETEIPGEDNEDEIPEIAQNKRRNPKRLRLIGDELYRINQYGKVFKLDIKLKV